MFTVTVTVTVMTRMTFRESDSESLTWSQPSLRHDSLEPDLPAGPGRAAARRAQASPARVWAAAAVMLGVRVARPPLLSSEAPSGQIASLNHVARSDRSASEPSASAAIMPLA